MTSSVETLSPTRVKLTVDVAFDDHKDKIEKAYQSIASQVNIPGFRKGKVPASIIDQRFGRGAVLQEVINEVLPTEYDKAIAEHEVVALAQPAVEVTELNEDKNFVFTAEVDVRPEFDLPQYEGIPVEVKSVETTDEDVDEQLTELRKRFGSLANVERAAQDGDVVEIDVEGLDGDQPVEQFSAMALSYEVGSSGMVEGADEALRGLSAGESASFNFTPPEGEFADKEIKINIEVKGVRERTLPDVDDEFAQLASEFDTVDELREDLVERVGKMKLVEQGMEAREKVIDQMLDSVEIPVPESVVEAQLGEHFQDGHGDDEHRQEVADETSKSIRTQFILDRIADEKELEVGQAELSQWLMSQAPRYGMTPDQFIQALLQGGQLEMAVADVRRGKALEHVLKTAVVTDDNGKEIDLSVLDEAVDGNDEGDDPEAEAVAGDEELEAADEAIDEVEAEENA